MRAFGRMDRQLLDAAGLAGHLVPEGSMFAFLSARTGPRCSPGAGYADPRTGGGAGRRSPPRRWLR